jgi:hypothetical protein
MTTEPWALAEGDAWGWMRPPGDPDLAGRPAEFVDVEPNVPVSGAAPRRRSVVLQLPIDADAEAEPGPAIGGWLRRVRS